MKIKSFAIAACLGLAVPTFAFAQSTSSEPAPSVQPAVTDPSGQPLICKYYADNGRIIPRRDCRTAHEWERIRRQTQMEVLQQQRLGDLQHSP